MDNNRHTMDPTFADGRSDQDLSTGRVERYTRVAIALHWTIAVLILFNLGIGFFMEGLPPAARGIVVTAHLSSGITVLGLTLVRIVWRLTHRPPPLLHGLHHWEQLLAKLVHVLFYAGMIVMPLSGWAIISANPPTGSQGAISNSSRRTVLPCGASLPRPYA